MLNKLLAFIREQNMLAPGDQVVCAVSGGADSVALLFALYLLKEKLEIQLEAAHFNHGLRQAESDEDEAFVRQLCSRYDIPLHLGRGTVHPGKKGLEAAAREARYAFLEALPGKIATAHTADDNAETVLMHLIRGTGLKGLGAIAPVRGKVIRPMLLITRQEVEAFLREWALPHREDSSNQSGAFLRNRIRHQVMPLLKQENPRLAQSWSRMALSLRQDEAMLEELAALPLPPVSRLRQLPPAQRSRLLAAFLKENGVREPEESHIALAESLVFSPKPSARAHFPGGVVIVRSYEQLHRLPPDQAPEPLVLTCPGEGEFGQWHVTCYPAQALENTCHVFTLQVTGPITIRSRQAGDMLTLEGGRKSVKKLLIDRKIPAWQRLQLPVAQDEKGLLGVCGIGSDKTRRAPELPAVTLRFEKQKRGEPI